MMELTLTLLETRHLFFSTASLCESRSLDQGSGQCVGDQWAGNMRKWEKTGRREWRRGWQSQKLKKRASPWGVRASGIPPSASALEKHVCVSEGNPKLLTKKCQFFDVPT